MDIRQAFSAYGTAQAEVLKAESALDAARGDADHSPGEPAFQAGALLAERRLALAKRHLDQATFTLTRGRPLYEVLWALPDDL